MSNFGMFRAQLVSIMEILAKAAVEEINRSVNDSCAVFRLEISQSQKEIETLKHKLQIVERELMKTRIRKTVCSPAARVLGQAWRSRSSEEELIAVEEVESPSQPSVARNQSRPEPFPIKRERMEEDLCCRDPQSSPTGEEQEKQAIPFGHSEELREQHRCGRDDEELSGLEFVVKAEQEGEHVAQRLNQTGCEFREGRFNNLGSEYVMYEGDNQMWTSFMQGNSDIESDDLVCSTGTEQCSQHQSIHSKMQLTPASVEVSGNALSFVGTSYAEEFDKMGEKLSVSSEELRSEAIHTQQGQYREKLLHTVERENQTLLPQQQQHGPSVKHRRGNEKPAQPQSGSPYWTGSALNTGSFVAGNHCKTRRRPSFRERLYSCTQCGKTFEQNSQLIIHRRSHTGEKPYRCADCGKRFSQMSNLRTHKRLHTGEKPFCCTHCGMCFAQQSNLITHQRIHTGEKPFICGQCERGFSQSSSLRTHQRLHCRN